MIRALYRASQAGVKVELNIRGICALRPGIQGVSDNIEVVSVLGRFLEHSRVYAFERNDETKIFMGSADLMQRNLYNRVELMIPVEDEVIRDELLDDPRPLARRQRRRLGARRRRRVEPPRPRRRGRAAERSSGDDRPRPAARRRRALGGRPCATTPTAGGSPRRTTPTPTAPALDGEQRADVLILGGGYTGMWTAWHIKALEPGARVVLVEADRCGHGPSGRNGGFVNGLWFSLAGLRMRFGDEAALDGRPRRRRVGRRDRRLVREAGSRRLVPPRRLPAGLGGAGPGRRPGAGARGDRGRSRRTGRS